jgi:hypothetical protein
MALIKGSNSYATVVEADKYFEGRLDVAAWISAEEPQKETALITATEILNNLEWIGVAVSESQTLAFPREGVYFDPFFGFEKTLDNTVPPRITKATFELAYHALNNDGLLDNTGSVSSISVGSISLQTVKAPSLIPSNVSKLITPLLKRGSTRTWWRAN